MHLLRRPRLVNRGINCAEMVTGIEVLGSSRHGSSDIHAVVVQGPISINVMAGAGAVLSDNIQGDASMQREVSSPRLVPHERGVLKTLV